MCPVPDTSQCSVTVWGKCGGKPKGTLMPQAELQIDSALLSPFPSHVVVLSLELWLLWEWEEILIFLD